MNFRPIVFKLGGATLRESAVTEGICRILSCLNAAGAPLVIIHGGGPAINEELTVRGITWQFIRGQRVTTDTMMDVIEMVLCGKVNKTLVRALNQAHHRAVGLSGTDARMLQCEPMAPELDRVGEVKKVSTAPIEAILQAGLLPVISPIGIGADGKAFNINADFAACRIAEALNAQSLIYLTDQDGILDQEQKLIASLTAAGLESLMSSGVVQGGMLAKTQTILHALSNGITDVRVMNGRSLAAADSRMPIEQMKGTHCHA